jgi:HEPN domain-containing protein
MPQHDDYRGFLYAAHKDALAAEALASLDVATHAEAIAFHAQQAAEKIVKSVFTSNGSVPSKTHAIDELVAQAIKVGWLSAQPDELDAAADLGMYAVVARYKTSPNMDAGEALNAIADCNKVADMVERFGYPVVRIAVAARYLHDEPNSDS